MPDKFQPDDRVFAKIKGWPPWPAKVVNRQEGKTESYMIMFYGTYDTSVVKPDSMYAYSEETKAKYGKTKNSNRWKEAMEEIENNTPIGDTGPLDEPQQAPMDLDKEGDEGEGGLMIDEGLPVLTKEGGNGKNGKEPGKPAARRGSKASLSKRDSISSSASTPTAAPEPTTPSGGNTPGTEIVSRSGRKIKPKRFADDEISTPASAKTKANQDDLEGPPTKRAKRGGKTPPAAGRTPVHGADETPEPPKPTGRARMVIGKGKNPPQTQTVSGKVSPDITVQPAAPTLKPAAGSVAKKGQETVEKKPLPALIPAAGPQQQQKVLPVRRPPPPLQQQEDEKISGKVEPEVTDEESGNEAPPMLDGVDEEGETEDKENLKEGQVISTTNSEMGSESELEMKMENDDRYSDVHDESLIKIQFQDKDGEPLEIRMESKETFDTEEDQKEYEASLQNAMKVKEDLESGEMDSVEVLQDLMDADRPEDMDPEDALLRERRANQIKTLRVEGEVIEIIGEIVSCLGERTSEIARAYELLERLGSHELTPLILKKHPEVVNTVSKLRCYVGNVDAWGFTGQRLEDFREGATEIRMKATEVYNMFYNVFIPPEEQDETVTFEDIFSEEMKLFKNQTKDLSMEEILSLTGELENGNFETFDLREYEGSEGMQEDMALA